jgi:hypothetical protein
MVDWVNVGVDSQESQHLGDHRGDEDSASYLGMVFQTVEGIAIHHDLQMARNHLEQLQFFLLYLYGEVNHRAKLILERNFLKYESPSVNPEHVISTPPSQRISLQIVLNPKSF